MPTASPNEFTLKVIDVIRKIPRGRVATYQQVAGLAGKPHASRAVSWILSSCSKKYKLPWHRVISSKGKIAFDARSRHFQLQKRLLTQEQVMVEGPTGSIRLEEFQYRKKAQAKRKRHQPRMFS